MENDDSLRWVARTIAGTETVMPELKALFESEGFPDVVPNPDGPGVFVNWELTTALDWWVLAHVVLRDGSLDIVELSIHPGGRPDGEFWDYAPAGGLPARLLSRTPWATLLKAIRQVAASRMMADVAIPPEEARQWRESVRPKKREPRSDWDEARYAALAREYAKLVGLGESKPTKVLGNNLGYSATTINQRVREARDLGLLTSSSPGRAGGSLTKKAKAILARMEGAI